MTHRRDFLTTLSAAGGTILLPPLIGSRRGAVEVSATPTIFHAHDGRVLVRFVVTGSDAPAGRLRVYDANRGFIGTAGVLPADGHLYGEFWIPIDGPTRISTDLELPRRTPYRTNHVLDSPRRWVVYWSTAVNAAAIQDRLDALPPLQRALEVQLLRRQQFVINPAPAAPAGLGLLSAVGALAPPHTLARDLGFDLGTIAHLDTAHVPPTLPSLLRGVGVNHVITNNSDPIQWLESPGGTRILGVGIGRLGNPDSLGFGGGPDLMAPLMERFLERQHSGTPEDHVLVASNRLTEDRRARLAAVEEWNGRYAFPRIEISAGPFPDPPVSDPIPVRRLLPQETTIPGAAQLRDAAQARIGVAAEGIGRLLSAAAAALGVSPDDVAGSFSLPAPGHLVFNGSPYTRSDVALLPDGGEFVATHVPATGFAYFPGSPRTQVDRSDSDLTASTGGIDLEIDPATGAIASLRDANGIEWVARGAEGGWNTIARCRLEAVRRETIPGLGTRLRLDRWSSARGSLTTIVTLYEELPWIDISNNCEGVGASALQYGFDLAVANPVVSWDLTVDRPATPAPTGRMAHDRFVAISGTDRAAYFRCHESPYFSVGANGRLVAHAGRGISRCRLAVISDERFEDDALRFGWNGDPFVVVETPGTGTGTSATFGSFLTTDRRDVTIVGLEPAADERGWIVYLQDQSGIGGGVHLRGGLIGFGSARQCDLLGRDIGNALVPDRDTVRIAIEPRGLAAVRIRDIRPGSP